MAREKQICFRVDESFFKEFIDEPRKRRGFDYISPFLRELLVADKTGRKRKISVPLEEDVRHIFAELEVMNVTLSDIALRIYNPENTPEELEFHQLSQRAGNILKLIEKRLLH